MRGQKAAFTLTEGATHVDLPPTRVRFAFTLTEVLLAVVIVGVLAALVLPAVVTHFQEKGFNQAYVRETKTLQSAIEGLAVNENKASFFETMMYKDAEPENYSDSAEYFLKKYLRVSKICGDNNGDCFGKTYYQYAENDKKVYNPEFKGSCAVLKNGASICLTPQVGAAPIVGLIDLNGRKAPNVLGKDLRTFSIAAETRLGHRSDTEAVLEYKFDPIVTAEGGEDPCAGKTCGCGTLPPCDPCEGFTCGCGSLPPCKTPCSSNPNEWDLTCCEENYESINSPEHHCCSFWNGGRLSEVCYPKVSFTFNIDYVCDYQDRGNRGSGEWKFWEYANLNCSVTAYSEDVQDYIKASHDPYPGVDIRIFQPEFFILNNLSNNTTELSCVWTSGSKNAVCGDGSPYTNPLFNIFPNGNGMWADTAIKKPMSEIEPPYIVIGDGSWTHDKASDYIAIAQFKRKFMTTPEIKSGFWRWEYQGYSLKYEDYLFE